MNFNIWPKSKTEFTLNFKNYIPKIEDYFQKLYPKSYPVFLSSGRSAIYCCLSALNLERKSLVAVSPYANACIFRSVGALSTPVPSNLLARPDCQLIYHQWGYVNSTNIKSKYIIEDSIDSLIINKKGLFPNKGDFEIISLSKIFGSALGAIVLCKNKLLKKKILYLREMRKEISFYQNILRFFSKYSSNSSLYWHNLQHENYHPGSYFTKQIFNDIQNFSNIINDRKKKILILKKFIEFKINEYRLPVVIPITVKNKNIFEKIEKLRKIKIFYKHFNKSFSFKKWNLEKKIIIPIHQEIPESLIYEVAEILDKNKQ